MIGLAVYGPHVTICGQAVSDNDIMPHSRARKCLGDTPANSEQKQSSGQQDEKDGSQKPCRQNNYGRLVNIPDQKVIRGKQCLQPSMSRINHQQEVAT